MPAYKEKCRKCRKNYAIIYSARQWPICKECELKEISKPVEDPTMKKFFDIPPAYYDQSSFLRSIKRNYLRFENISDKQREYFIKVVNEFKQGIAREQQPKKEIILEPTIEKPVTEQPLEKTAVKRSKKPKKEQKTTKKKRKHS